MGGARSCLTNADTEVSQSSTLGPLLFLAFTKDATAEINSVCCLFTNGAENLDNPVGTL